MWKAFLDTLPRGYTLDEADWQRRHRLLLRLLAAHVPALAVVGLLLGNPPATLLVAVSVPAVCVVLGHVLRSRRRSAAVAVTAGLVYSSGALVGLSGGAIEAHFHFFIIIGFIALYQDWAPFLFNILFTVISHGVGSLWQQSLIFNHAQGQANPWLWSLIHGVAVLFACAGMTVFWRVTEDSQREKDALARRLAEAEINKRQFTSDLLVNLARRNQSMLYRQLDIINQLEESEQDPEALADLFTLDHLTTRVRRNAESLLVLSGEQPPRTWSDPVPLRDVLRAAIAETEDLDRVVFVVDERPAVAGHTVTDLTHLLAELTENAVRFSPPDSVVTIRARADRNDPGGHLLTVEDWGVGMPAAELAEANALFADPPEVDLSVSQRLGFHVVARLAARHGIGVSLTATPGSGVTAVVVLPSELFEPARPGDDEPATPSGWPAQHAATAPLPKRPARPRPGGVGPQARPEQVDLPDRIGRPDHAVPVGTLTATRDQDTSWGRGSTPFGGNGDWRGWWDPADGSDPAAPATAPVAPATPAVVPNPRPRPAPSPRVPREPREPADERSTGPSGPAPSTGPSAPVDPVTGLRRRIPQSHLVPELREANTTHAGPAVPDPRQTGDAANALSRYQASRQAAQAAAEGVNGNGGVNGNAAGDGGVDGNGGIEGNRGWRA